MKTSVKYFCLVVGP